MINLTKNNWQELGKSLIHAIVEAEILTDVIDNVLEIEVEDIDYDSLETKILERITESFK